MRGLLEGHSVSSSLSFCMSLVVLPSSGRVSGGAGSGQFVLQHLGRGRGGHCDDDARQPAASAAHVWCVYSWFLFLLLFLFMFLFPFPFPFPFPFAFAIDTPRCANSRTGEQWARGNTPERGRSSSASAGNPNMDCKYRLQSNIAALITSGCGSIALITSDPAAALQAAQFAEGDTSRRRDCHFDDTPPVHP